MVGKEKGRVGIFPLPPFIPPSLLPTYPSLPPSYLPTPTSYLPLPPTPPYQAAHHLPPHCSPLTSSQHAVLPGAPGSSQRGPESDGTQSGVVLHAEPRGVSSRVLTGRGRVWLMLFSSCICHTKAQQLIYILNRAD